VRNLEFIDSVIAILENFVKGEPVANSPKMRYVLAKDGKGARGRDYVDKVVVPELRAT